MRVLVTGHNGFIGSVMVDVLARKFVTEIVYNTDPAGQPLR